MPRLYTNYKHTTNINTVSLYQRNRICSLLTALRSPQPQPSFMWRAQHKSMSSNLFFVLKKTNPRALQSVIFDVALCWVDHIYIVFIRRAGFFWIVFYLSFVLPSRRLFMLKLFAIFSHYETNTRKFIRSVNFSTKLNEFLARKQITLLKWKRHFSFV